MQISEGKLEGFKQQATIVASMRAATAKRVMTVASLPARVARLTALPGRAIAGMKLRDG